MVVFIVKAYVEVDEEKLQSDSDPRVPHWVARRHTIPTHQLWPFATFSE